MPFDLTKSLVIGVASSALFDTSKAAAVFYERDLGAYRDYQDEHLDECLGPGPAFPFVKRILALNSLSDASEARPLVEVILFTRNDPETGFRAAKSIDAYGLPITRRIYMGGRSPHLYMGDLNVSLFLSANENDVRDAMAQGIPSGLVLASSLVDDEGDPEVRVAFDFDGVLADDSAELVYKRDRIDGFRKHETDHAFEPLPPGPLHGFLVKLRQIQLLEERMHSLDRSYRPQLRVSMVTARNAPADARAINTLKQWGVRVDEACFLGGVDKGTIARVLRPHIYFDDQLSHLESTARYAPSVHVPFGVLNEVDLVQRGLSVAPPVFPEAA